MKYKVIKGDDPFDIIDKSYIRGCESHSNVNASPEKPYTIGVVNWDGDGGEPIGINCLVEIHEPFIQYIDDGYDATEHIELMDGTVYRCLWSTPMEAQIIGNDVLDDWDFEDEDDREKVKKHISELKNMNVNEIIG